MTRPAHPPRRPRTTARRFRPRAGGRCVRGCRRSRSARRSPSAGRPLAPGGGWRRSHTRSAAPATPRPAGRAAPAGRSGPANPRQRVTRARTSRLNCGYSVSSCRDTVSISARAWSSGDPVVETRDRQNAGMPSAIVRQRRGPWPHRHVEVGRLKQLEPGWQDTDDRVRLLVELQLRPRKSGAPSKRRIHKPWLDNHHARRARLIVGSP